MYSSPTTGTVPMLDPSMMLVTTDSSLVASVQEVIRPVPNLELRVFESVDEANPAPATLPSSPGARSSRLRERWFGSCPVASNTAGVAQSGGHDRPQRGVRGRASAPIAPAGRGGLFGPPSRPEPAWLPDRCAYRALPVLAVPSCASISSCVRAVPGRREPVPVCSCGSNRATDGAGATGGPPGDNDLAHW